MRNKVLFIILLGVSAIFQTNAQNTSICEAIVATPSAKYIECNEILEECIKELQSPEYDETWVAFGCYSSLYDSLWREQCNKRSIPEAFCLLPIALTQLNNNYNTPYKAGIWALSPTIARYYGLRIDEQYDERYNIELSTRAAMDYLQALYNYYEQDFWLTVLTFSNSAVEVHDASLIYNNQEPSIWEWYTNENLSQREIIPKLMAYIYLYRFFPVTHRELVETPIIVSDTLPIGLLCEKISYSADSLKTHNPALSSKARQLLPGYTIYLPSEKHDLFVTHQQEIAAQAREQIRQEEKARQAEIARQKALAAEPEIYRVKAGDTLGHIAQRYGVSVSQLKKWNNLKSDILQIGQRIKIFRHS